MGAGFHGKFGNTLGFRYRKGFPVDLTNKDLEMSLNPLLYIEKVYKKYNIHLRGSGQNIDVIYNPNLKIVIAGRTCRNKPNVIELGPGALISEYELANTIAHELNHARSFLKNGDAPEKTAYNSGDNLEKYMRGER